MKKILVLISVLVLLISCNQEKNDFTNHEWILHYLTFEEDYNYQERQRTFFRNDSVISFSELKNKEISFPIVKSDSTIIIKQQRTLSDKENVNKRDTIIIDTMLYDFKYVLNKPILALKMLNSDYIKILTCKNDNAEINETNNFFSITSFKIGGLSIGDTIEQSLLTNIKDYEDYLVKGLVEANLIGNENIHLILINKNIIYSISQEMLEDNAIVNIIEVINKKAKTKIDTITKSPPFYTEGYRWGTAEIKIELSKKNMTKYYLDVSRDYSNSESMRSRYLDYAIENVGKIEYWTLTYDNLFLQTILKYHQENKTISTVIE